MQTFRVRCLRPSETEWVSIEANSPEEAATEYHFTKKPPSINISRKTEARGYESVMLSRVEIEGHGETLVRSFYTGIGRSGGVKPPPVVLKEVAEALGFEGDPNELIADGWYLEDYYGDFDRIRVENRT